MPAARKASLTNALEECFKTVGLLSCTFHKLLWKYIYWEIWCSCHLFTDKILILPFLLKIYQVSHLSSWIFKKNVHDSEKATWFWGPDNALNCDREKLGYIKVHTWAYPAFNIIAYPRPDTAGYGVIRRSASLQI